jgi:hypothetical protein
MPNGCGAPAGTGLVAQLRPASSEVSNCVDGPMSTVTAWSRSMKVVTNAPRQRRIQVRPALEVK